jgi:hypothetical protein
MGRTKPYKWIAAEIESLDPEVDYERIWALSTTYYVNDFVMNVLYSTGMPHFILAPSGGQTIARGGHGKAIMEHQKREKDTMAHFWKWFELGPSSMATQKSVKQVNNLHRKYAQEMPGNFANDDEFIYTMCWIGADMHRLRLRLGLPGYTQNQQIACHRYWREISKLFVTENGPLTRFPEDFDAMLTHMVDYENQPWEHSPEGAMACEHLLRQFSDRWTPRLPSVGRNFILALLDEPPHRVHRLPYPGKLTRKLVELFMRSVMTLQERVLPDPELSTPEKKRLMAAKESIKAQEPDPDLARAA